MKEENRTRLWRITATASLLIAILVAAFFMIRIMVDNPTRGTWISTDSDLTLTIPSFGAVTASWPESDELSDVTVKMNSEINRGEQLIAFEPDFKVVEKKAREAQDPDTLRADMNMLNGTFYYEAAEDMLTLRNPDSGNQIVFEKAH